MATPQLSVVMPNYNHAAYIGRALDAILTQSLLPSEVIVVDDGSTDNSLEVIGEFARRSPLIRLIQNESNRGVVFTLNRGLQEASGYYVTFPGADDYILPGFYERSVGLLQRNDTAGLCVGDSLYFDGNSGAVTEARLRLSEQARYISPDELLEITMNRFVPPLFSQTAVYRRNALVEAGGFLPELKWSGDWFALLVVAIRYGFCYIPEPVAAMRMIPDTYSSSGHRDKKAEREIVLSMLRLLDTPAYNDLKPFFLKTAAFSCYPDKVLRTLLTSVGHRDYVSLLLMRHALAPLKPRLKSFIYRTTPPILRKLHHARQARARARAGDADTH